MKRQFWQHGQSLVEMTVITVVLIILLGGLFDLGRAFIILVAVENATGEGALYGATHPECLAAARDTTCPDGNGESVVSRVVEEGEPVITLLPEDIDLFLANGDGSGEAPVADGSVAITGGKILRVDATYTYSPITPIGFLLWGDTASITATARQHVMSPPRPGS